MVRGHELFAYTRASTVVRGLAVAMVGRNVGTIIDHAESLEMV
jgi:hypothetical protein